MSIKQANIESFKTFDPKTDTDVKPVVIEAETASNSFLGQISQEVELSDLKGVTKSNFGY